MLIECKECQGQVSDKALICPHCGIPLGKRRNYAARSPQAATQWLRVYHKAKKKPAKTLLSPCDQQKERTRPTSAKEYRLF